MGGELAVRSDQVEQVERVAALVQQEFVPDSPTHDHGHLARVASISSQICAAEGGDQLVVLCASWLHDLHRSAQDEDGQFFVSPERMDEHVRSILDRAEIPEGIHERILEAIHYTDRFSFSDRSIYKTTPEARAVRDADCLDAIGAIGVARAFSFGAVHRIPLWDDEAGADHGIYLQSERPSSTIQHFYDKLLRLSAELETPTAKELAGRRSEFMHEFLAQFMQEWRIDLGSD